MSERIEKLHPRELEQLQDDFNTGQLGMADVSRLFAHIDALTRERDALKAANGVLRETCEGTVRALDKLAELVRCRLDATASGKGE